MKSLHRSLYACLPLACVLSPVLGSGWPSAYIAPGRLVIAAGQSHRFQLRAVSGAGDLQVSGSVRWSSSAGGAIDGNGLFTASAIPGLYQGAVTAQAGGKTAIATVEVVDAKAEGGYVFVKCWGAIAPGQLGSPGAIAAHPGGSFYVSDTANNRIQRFSASGQPTGEWGKQGSLPGEFSSPAAIAFGPGGELLIADTGNGRVQVFDGRMRYLRSLGPLREPYGVAVSADGLVYVSDTAAGRISVFRMSGDHVRDISRGLEGVQGIAIDSSGRIWAALWGKGRVVCIDQNGKQLRSIGGGALKLGSPGDIAIGRKGLLYITDMKASSVLVVTPDGKLVRRVGTRGGGDGEMKWPGGAALDRQGRLLVTDSGNHRILVFSSDAKFVEKWGSPGSLVSQMQHPEAVAVAQDGRMAVADSASGSVQLFNSNGLPLYRKPGLKRPVALAFDDNGSLYVAESATRRILRFDRDGKLIGSFTLPAVSNISGVAAWGGGIAVSDAAASSVRLYSTSGKLLRQLAGAGQDLGQVMSPHGLASGPDGSLTVADTGNNRIQRFGGSGAFETSWGLEGSGESQLRNPTSVAARADGTTAVADSSNHRVQLFSRDGDLIGVIRQAGTLGLQLPLGVAFGPRGELVIADTGNGRVAVYRRK